ncbi:thioredoxin family protein [Winogradskyella aurantia]|uniref:Uncharacterized protein n=1 Tax=Winogradskyella aurantia TaxID=1915063 RepID=A0A265UPA9_9FLAO|nr:thioredoxin family protein [Winogradskyella aurantia]OZV67120.1 hypothetical protein CA834_12410 [Winogradskyella aurantia]
MKTNVSSTVFALIISFFSQAQSLNTQLRDTEQQPHLLGEINKSDLENGSYGIWFLKNYKAYKPDSKIIETLKSDLKGYTLKLFMGTWCGDSKREVPILYKVLDQAEFPQDQLIAIALSNAANMYKQSPQHEEAGLNIHRVPTLIIYQNGKEINRIVEEPVESFEKDLLNIIQGKKYVSNYNIVTVVNDILKYNGVKGLKRKEKTLLKDFYGKVSSIYALNTYGRILYTTKRTEDALAVFELNTKFFPEEARTYMTYANTLKSNGYEKQAIKVLKSAIARHPENQTLVQNLKMIRSN